MRIDSSLINQEAEQAAVHTSGLILGAGSMVYKHIPSLNIFIISSATRDKYQEVIYCPKGGNESLTSVFIVQPLLHLIHQSVGRRSM